MPFPLGFGRDFALLAFTTGLNNFAANGGRAAARFVLNAWRSGMLASLQCGLSGRLCQKGIKSARLGA
jgi:hypothetical protein